jgi:uncharacterized protein DUF1254
LAIERADEAAA